MKLAKPVETVGEPGLAIALTVLSSLINHENSDCWFATRKLYLRIV